MMAEKWLMVASGYRAQCLLGAFVSHRTKDKMAASTSIFILCEWVDCTYFIGKLYSIMRSSGGGGV